jgi:hypothetical protein
MQYFQLKYFLIFLKKFKYNLQIIYIKNYFKKMENGVKKLLDVAKKHEL